MPAAFCRRSLGTSVERSHSAASLLGIDQAPRRQPNLSPAPALREAAHPYSGRTFARPALRSHASAARLKWHS